MANQNPNNLTLEELARLRRREAKLQAAGVSTAVDASGDATLGSILGGDRSPPARANAESFDKWYFEPQSEEDGDAWLMTYLDTITLLLVFLLVMLMMAGKGGGQGVREGITLGNLGIFNRNKSPSIPIGSQTPIPKAAGGDKPIPLPQSGQDTPKKDPAQGLDLGDLGKDIDVVVNDKSISFRINSEILFSSGQAELSRDGLAVLQKLVSVMKKNNHKITIEGHTDSVPIRGGRFPSNWELSSFRAGSVVRYFEANGISSDRLRAIGYADTKPLTTNDTADNRAKNRRVELLMETVDEEK